MLSRCLLIGVLLLIASGCGDSPAKPSAVNPPESPGAPAPASSFSLTIDGLGSEEAIAAVSHVTVDAGAWTLVTAGYYNEWSGLIYDGPAIASGATLVLKAQEGTNVSGFFYRFPDSFRFTGAVNADGQVRLQFADTPTTLTGAMTLAGFGAQEQQLELTFHGGPFDGRIFRAYWRKGY